MQLFYSVVVQIVCVYGCSEYNGLNNLAAPRVVFGYFLVRQKERRHTISFIGAKSQDTSK